MFFLMKLKVDIIILTLLSHLRYSQLASNFRKIDFIFLRKITLDSSLLICDNFCRQSQFKQLPLLHSSIQLIRTTQISICHFSIICRFSIQLEVALHKIRCLPKNLYFSFATITHVPGLCYLQFLAQTNRRLHQRWQFSQEPPPVPNYYYCSGLLFFLVHRRLKTSNIVQHVLAIF